jgi:carboxypeptidase Taq
VALDKLREYLREYSYLKGIQSLLYWDTETYMPPGAIDDRARRLAYVQGKIHAHMTSRRYESLLEAFEAGKLSARERRLARELRWDQNLFKVLPARHVTELSHAQAIATHAWSEARKKNDWAGFRPHLEKLIALKRRETTYYGGAKPYDSLIKLHDKEFDAKTIARLFGELKAGLLRLTREVEADRRFVDVADLKGPFPVEKQRELSLRMARRCGLPEANGRLDVSAHPFSINVSPRDQRITTRYAAGNLDSLSSTMHEVGHALYELNLPAEWEGTPFQEAVSLSVHESQSRFWENVVGRSREFCDYLHPVLAELFPTAMKKVGPEELFRALNKSAPNLIRVEAAELYYNLHVIIRFELEELIFNHNLGTDELPELWNQKYREYLGLVPPDYARGVLQDSHWGGAAFGYFPTYTLGNLISGSLYRQLKREVRGFRRDLRAGDLGRIGEFLKTRVHEKGRSVSAVDLVGKIDVKDYLSYLREKFRS